MKYLILSLSFLALNTTTHVHGSSEYETGEMGLENILNLLDSGAHKKARSALADLIGNRSFTIKELGQLRSAFLNQSEIFRSVPPEESKIKSQSLSTQELRQLRSALLPGQPKLFKEVCQIQKELAVIDDLKSRQAHVIIAALETIIALPAAELGQFSSSHFQEIDLLMGHLIERAEHDVVFEKTKQAQIALANSLIEQERMR